MRQTVNPVAATIRELLLRYLTKIVASGRNKLGWP